MVNQFGIAYGTPAATYGLQQISVSLIGLAPQTIVSKLFGVYHVEVSSTTAGAPTFSCDIAKRSAADGFYIKNVNALPAADTCAIGISWDAGAYLKISKSLASYNGLYTVVLVGKTP
jgi:hypothetical protein